MSTYAKSISRNGITQLDNAVIESRRHYDAASPFPSVSPTTAIAWIWGDVAANTLLGVQCIFYSKVLYETEDAIETYDLRQ